jgi:hypothetical protein
MRLGKNANVGRVRGVNYFRPADLIVAAQTGEWAIQTFGVVVRQAMWIAHSQKCAYTHELVDLASMHIDHIIPESLAGRRRRALRARTG